MRNSGLKLLSLLIAALLAWFVNSENNVGDAQIFVPLKIENVPDNRMLVRPLARQLVVTLKGPSYQIARASAQPLTIKARLPDGVSDRYQLALRHSDIPVPPSIEVVRIDPSEIEVILEEKVSRDLPVRVEREGKLDAGLRIDSIVTQPDRVTVVGPSSELKSLNDVQTYPIMLPELKESSALELDLKVPGNLTTVLPSTVRVHVNIVPLQGTRRFGEREIELRAPSGSERLEISPSRATIEIKGEVERIKGLGEEQVVPYVRLSHDQDLSKPFEVAVDLPEWVTVSKIEPRTVTLSRLTPSESKSKSGIKGK